MRSISLLLWCHSSLLRWHCAILSIRFSIHIEINWQSFGPMKKLISLNTINKNSSMLTRGNLAPSSSLISRIIQCSSIRDGMIWRDILSICECSAVDWQMLSPTQQMLSWIFAFWNGKNMTFDSQWWPWCWRASFRPSSVVLWWEFLFRLGSMMALGPNRMNNWHIYNLRHKNWLHLKQFATFYLLPILKIFGCWI